MGWRIKVRWVSHITPQPPPAHPEHPSWAAPDPEPTLPPWWTVSNFPDPLLESPSEQDHHSHPAHTGAAPDRGIWGKACARTSDRCFPKKMENSDTPIGLSDGHHQNTSIEEILLVLKTAAFGANRTVWKSWQMRQKGFDRDKAFQTFLSKLYLPFFLFIRNKRKIIYTHMGANTVFTLK